MSRQALLSATPKTQNGAMGALRRRGSSVPAAPEIIPFVSDDVLLTILKGPIYQEFRDGDYIHVSDLIYKCARKIALSKSLGQSIDPEPLFDSASLTFKQGEAMAEFIVNKTASKAPDNVYGIWGCSCDTTKQRGTKSEIAGVICDKCGHGLHRYHEITVRDEERKVSGSIDLILRIEGAYLLTEIKSMKKEQWDDLQRPVPEHLIQILFYWQIMRALGEPLHDRVSVLYAAKSYMFKSPYKEFIIQPSVNMHRLDEYLDEAAILHDAIHKGGPLPARVTCPSPDSPAAKKCQFGGVCFQLP